MEHSIDNSSAAAEIATTQPAHTWKVGLQRWIRRFIVRVVVYFVVYIVVSILTIGPMFWHWHEAIYMRGNPWIAYFYLPLVLLCDAIPWLGDLVNAWVNWWIL